MNLDCLITIDEDSYLIHVDPAFALAVTEEFQLYAKEQTQRREEDGGPVFRSGVEMALLWVISLFLVFILQDRDPELSDRFLNSSTALVSDGEFWRPMTALFLHGDLGHLLGNVAFGLIFGILVAATLGALVGWGLILASGFIGNTVNAVLHYPDVFRSLGASTATFGALGLLVGAGIYHGWRNRSYREGLRILLPLFAGLILLAQMGVGGPEVDVWGHFWGFLTGVILGIPAALLRGLKDTPAEVPA